MRKSARQKLAERLNEMFPGYNIVPGDIRQQAPAYLRYESGCCHWFVLKNENRHGILGFGTIADCAKYGIEPCNPRPVDNEKEIEVKACQHSQRQYA